MDGRTFRTDTGELIRGVHWASDITGRAPSREQVSRIKQQGLNALHLYGEAFPRSDNPGYLFTVIDTLVDWTREEDLYLILTIGCAGQNGSFDYDYAIGFWNFYAPRYKDETHLIYEIHNEPHKWSPGYPAATLDMERDVYNVIRGHAPDTPILLLSYAVFKNSANVFQDVTSLGAGIDWSNAAIAFHGYAGAGATRSTLHDVLQVGIPCFQTEFAEDPQTLHVEETLTLEDKGVSWLAFIRVDRLSPFKLMNVADRNTIAWRPDFGDWPVHVHHRINVGGDCEKPFREDGFGDAGTGAPTLTPNATDLSHPLAAPSGIYQTARTGDMALSLDGYPSFQPYTLRLHFVETQFSAPGQRVFDIRVNGEPRLPLFDPFAAAGANNRAVVVDLPVRTDDLGRLVVELLTGTASVPMLHGLEVAPVLPRPWRTTVVGTIPHDLRGGASCGHGTWVLEGAGRDIWGSVDSFRYVYQEVQGNVMLEAWVTGLENTDQWAKSGIMFRNSTDANSIHGFLAVSSRNGVVFHVREQAGGSTGKVLKTTGLSVPHGLRLVRTGNRVDAFISSDGVNWSSHGSVDLDLRSTFTMGLAHSSNNTAKQGSATFSRVRTERSDNSRDAFFRIEAEHAEEVPNGGSVEACAEGGLDLGGLSDGSIVGYGKADFGEDAAFRLRMRVAANQDGGRMELHPGSTNGPASGSASIPATGGVQQWQTVCMDVPALSGTQTVRLKCVGPSGWKAALNWFCFERGGDRTLHFIDDSVFLVVGTDKVTRPISDALNAPTRWTVRLNGGQNGSSEQTVKVSLDDRSLGSWTPVAGQTEEFFSYAPPGTRELALIGQHRFGAIARVDSLEISAQTARPIALIPRFSRWRYRDAGGVPPSDWRDIAFDDSGWSSGFAQLGFGDGGDEVTVIADNQQIVTQFRHCFHVQHPARYTRLLLRLLADDGAVVYLNGRQVARKNLPAGPLTPFTWALSGLGAADENLLTDFAIPPALLFKGRNVIAVAVHQAQSTGNDLSFDLELSAEAGFATAPRLNIARSDDGIRLCWPADVAGFHLQYSETLLDPLTWQAVPDAAEWFGGDVGVQLQHDAVPVFYRLVLE